MEISVGEEAMNLKIKVVKSERRVGRFGSPNLKGGVILQVRLIFWQKKGIDKTSSVTSTITTTKQLALFNMPHRAGSPAVSENEFDIANSLFKDDVDAEDDDFGFPTSKDLGNLDAGGILDLGVESDGDGDEEFIAAQQAASNRKASNVKGKSVKKGGGFQAMGREHCKLSEKKVLILVKD
jgi:hypothetical protein